MSQVVKTSRKQIEKLEATMMAMPEHHIDIPTSHHFAPGLYAREIKIPAGATIAGKIHRTEHLNLLLSGTLEVVTENGVEVLTGPRWIVSKPGTKRVGHAHTDAIWVTFHPTEETDLGKLEAELIAPSFEALEGPVNPLPLEGV